MELSSSRFKSLAITAGFSFWFFIISNAIGIFTIEVFLIFVASLLSITQIFSSKISRGLDIFAIINTKIFLGALFVIVISIYGLIFKLLRIDLLRLQKQEKSYWLKIDENEDNNLRQY